MQPEIWNSGKRNQITNLIATWKFKVTKYYKATHVTSYATIFYNCPYTIDEAEVLPSSIVTE